jgi:hypothetical protein
MLLFALVYLAPRHVPSAREDPKEEQRPLEDGSYVGRSGTGGIPCAFRIRAIVDRPTRCPCDLQKFGPRNSEGVT